MKSSGAVIRALVLGVAMGGVASVTPSCGPPRRPVVCNSTTCPTGCCDENAQCWTGLSDTQCGNAGASCSICPAGQTCVAAATGGDAGVGGRCSGASMTGGGSAGGSASTGGGSAGGTSSTGGGSGGGSTAVCNAQNCASGCCTATGTCQNPATTARCGSGGAACMACPSGRTCVSGACEPCNGCIDLATGRCEAGTANDKCGKTGEFCSNCMVSNGTCNASQVCVGNSSGCNPTNCPSGCCDLGTNTCILPGQQSGQQCGQGGAASVCTQCPSGQCDTDGGVCVGGTGGGPGGGIGGGLPNLDGGFPAGCDGVTNLCAATECCLTNVGLCVGIGQGLPPLLTACGLNGGVCSTCTFPRTCSTSTGMCQ